MNGTARRVEVDDLGQLAEGSRLATGARVAVIVNRGAGRLPDRGWEERAAAILARRLRPTFEHPVSAAETARLAAEHARAGVAAVVVAGGDGTINRVVNELAGTGVPIGILPRGTANDFAREVDLPLEIAAAARRVLEGGVRAIDVIDVNGRAFVTVGGLGLPAACALSVGRLKRAGGLALVALAALGPAVYPVVAAANVLLRARRLHRLRITYRRPDGRLRTVERESHGLFVANQRALGGGIGLPTRSDNSDGVFELALLSAESRASLLATLAAMRLGRPVSRWTLGVWRAVEARIECERPLAFFGDGDEIGLARSFTVRVLPRALRVLR